MVYPAVHQLIGRVSARSGVSFSAHMLRPFSCATDMVRQGVPVEVVARLLTHRWSTTTSQTYVHLEAADIKDALLRAGFWAGKAGQTVEPGHFCHPGPGTGPQCGCCPGHRPGRGMGSRPLGRRPPRGAVPAGTWQVARFDTVTQGWLLCLGPALVPVPPRHRLCLLKNSAGALALFCFFCFLAHQRVTNHVLYDNCITKMVRDANMAGLVPSTAIGLQGGTLPL